MQGPIICYGEVLWDLLPSGPLPGGAPMNVAIHLQNFGINTTIISRVGDDKWGKDILAFIEDKMVDSSTVQVDPDLYTGTVQVDLSDVMEAKYTIIGPVAWDNILWDNEAVHSIQDAEGFVYGSLVARTPSSLKMLLNYLDIAELKVFDVNLRPPHFEKETIDVLMSKANLVKLNEDELNIMSSWYGNFIGEETKMRFLADHFQLDLICVTKGAHGAALLYENQYHVQTGFKVEVADTIGSGDSFLAALIKKWKENAEAKDMLEYACAVGALVATYNGANPKIKESEISALIEQKRVFLKQKTE
ncbi:MAG: carbohydrate kinase [Bacteroidota bacterium]